MSSFKILDWLIFVCLLLVLIMWTIQILKVQELVEIAVDNNITLPIEYHELAHHIKYHRNSPNVHNCF